MKELYRVFHYSNGFNFRLDGIVTDALGQRGDVQYTLTSGETVYVPAGWIATSFKPFVAPASVAVEIPRDPLAEFDYPF